MPYHLKLGDMGKDYYAGSLLCATCGQPADLVEVDFGIGSYEFWGAPGVDTNVQLVTQCCESNLVDNNWAERVAHKWRVVS